MDKVLVGVLLTLVALSTLSIYINNNVNANNVSQEIRELEFDYYRNFYVVQKIETWDHDPWDQYYTVMIVTSTTAMCGKLLQMDVANSASSIQGTFDVDQDIPTFNAVITFSSTTYAQTHYVQVCVTTPANPSCFKAIALNTSTLIGGRTYQYRLRAPPAVYSSNGTTIVAQGIDTLWPTVTSCSATYSPGHAVEAYRSGASVSISPSISLNKSLMSDSTVRIIIQLSFPTADDGKTIDKLILKRTHYYAGSTALGTTRYLKITWSNGYTITAGDVITVVIDLVLSEP